LFHEGDPNVFPSGVPEWLNDIQLCELLHCTERQLKEEYTAQFLERAKLFFSERGKKERREMKKLESEARRRK
jgi:hypothetical protein